MRKPLIAGNWKLNKSPKDAKKFIDIIKPKLSKDIPVETLICAPDVDLPVLLKNTEDINLNIGAENCFFENEGAYTGETSPKVLHEMGVKYVIIGHSERRQYFKETDLDINKKLKLVVQNDISPILCCGESLEIRENNQAKEWVESQIKKDLKDVLPDQINNLVIAYEPIWAIGTGQTANSNQAEEMCVFIRNIIKKLYDENVASSLRILYGGSVKSSNIKELMSQPDIDGGLIGGASLDPNSFLKLIYYYK